MQERTQGPRERPETERARGSSSPAVSPQKNDSVLEAEGQEASVENRAPGGCHFLGPGQVGVMCTCRKCHSHAALRRRGVRGRAAGLSAGASALTPDPAEGRPGTSTVHTPVGRQR